MANTTTQPNLQTGAAAAQLSTNLLTLFGDAKPQISNKYWWQYGYYCAVNTFNTMGMIRNVAGSSAQHLEGGHPVPNWQIGSVVTPAVNPNDPMVVTVATAYINTITATPFVYQYDTVTLKSGYEAYVSNVALVGGLWQVTLQPLDPSWILSGSAGDGVWQQGQFMGEGSNTPANARVTPSVNVSFPLQIIWNQARLSGSSELTELWSDVDQFGNKINPYYKEVMPLEMRQTTEWDNQIFFGYPNLSGVNGNANKMIGMNYAISNGGVTNLYPNGLFTLVDIQTMARVSIKQTAGSEFFGFSGPDFDFAAQSGLSPVFSQNPIVYETAANHPLLSKFMGNQGEFGDSVNASSKGIMVNFKRVQWSNINFYFVPMQRIGQIQAAGQSGFKQPGYCFWIPMSKAANVKGELVDRFKLTVRESEGKSRKMQTWSYGGAAPQNKNGFDGIIIECLSEVGTEYYDLSKFQLSVPF